jgi:parvulin-like peptidyl-prolyl isomerase
MLLPRDVPLSPQSDIARQFGESFAAALAEANTGSWVGPVESGYGLHLVFVRQREEGRLPGLDEVRDRVANDWAASRRREAVEAAYRTLRERYAVVVERGGATR